MTSKYNTYSIGIARDGVADNFVSSRPRKEHLIAQLRIPPSEDADELLENSGLDVLTYGKRGNHYRLRLTAGDRRRSGRTYFSSSSVAQAVRPNLKVHPPRKPPRRPRHLA
jgi:hypothetical protein